MILNDKQIRCLANEHNMITPFTPELVKGNGIISYGLSSCGYDPKLANEFKIFKNAGEYTSRVINPKKFVEDSYVTHVGDTVVIPPNGFILARTEEEFNIPDDVFGIVISKSTYARCGIICNVTPLEPGSRGIVTLEFSNTTSQPVMMFAGEGACQFVFFKGEKPDVTYLSRGGKYLNQRGVTDPKID